MSAASIEILQNPIALFLQFKIIEDARIDRHNRGRVETRTCTMASANWIENKASWDGLKNVFKIDRDTYYQGEATKETRYYITSLDTEASKLLGLARRIVPAARYDI